MRKILAFFVLLAFLFPQNTFASSAKAEAEANVEASGNVEVHQVVETTVNGQTVRKESNQPGKLELKMEQKGNEAPNVTFNQEKITPTFGVEEPLEQQTATTEQIKGDDKSSSFIAPVVEFIKKLLSSLASLTSWFK